MQTLPKWAIWAGIVLILATGLVHLVDAPDSFEETFYKGVLFIANGLAAVVAAVGIWRGAKSWGWTLGLAVAGGAFVGYVLSRTVGLPGLPAEPDAWLEPMGVFSMLVEVLFVGLSAWVLMRTPAMSSQRPA